MLSQTYSEKNGIGEDKKIITYLGTIEERKNPLSIMRVAKKLRLNKDIYSSLHVGLGSMGGGTKRSREAGNIIMTGESSDEFKASLIKASYLNVILSRMEAFGLTQLEFLYGGVPVITSGGLWPKRLIRNGSEGLHVNGSAGIDGAVKAILTLAKDDTKYEEMRKMLRIELSPS